MLGQRLHGIIQQQFPTSSYSSIRTTDRFIRTFLSIRGSLLRFICGLVLRRLLLGTTGRAGLIVAAAPTFALRLAALTLTLGLASGRTLPIALAATLALNLLAAALAIALVHAATLLLTLWTNLVLARLSAHLPLVESRSSSLSARTSSRLRLNLKIGFHHLMSLRRCIIPT
jgi:hypothetical protein